MLIYINVKSSNANQKKSSIQSEICIGLVTEFRRTLVYTCRTNNWRNLNSSGSKSERTRMPFWSPIETK